MFMPSTLGVPTLIKKRISFESVHCGTGGLLLHPNPKATPSPGGAMYKNQLQERAQKEHVHPPSYTSIQTSPQHAPRFKATVNFHGEDFHSGPDDDYPTLKQAELAAAQAALTKLGPSRVCPVASPLVMDEQNVYKNLLQELAQKAGVALPKYTTMQSGPPNQRLFTSTVEVASMSLQGQYALTIKNAEKNAAMFAWSIITECTNEGRDVLESGKLPAHSATQAVASRAQQGET